VLAKRSPIYSQLVQSFFVEVKWFHFYTARAYVSIEQTGCSPQLYFSKDNTMNTPFSTRFGKSLKQQTLLAVSILSLSFFSTIDAQAERLNCNTPSTDVEKMICGDEELRKLDQMMYSYFINALKTDKKTVMDEQEAWLRKRDKCDNTECLAKSYDVRIKSLGLAKYHNISVKTYKDNLERKP
jgi:uncharacterized protein YecT (DUF1311 family)